MSASRSRTGTLIEDHQKADEKVVQLARQHNLSLSGMSAARAESSAGAPDSGMAPRPVALNADGRRTVAKLSRLRGTAFDREFVTSMTEGHQKALDLINASKQRIDNDDIESVLGDIQSSVKKHLDHARGLQNGTGGRKTDTPSTDPAAPGRRSAPTAQPHPMH
jgi:uncharacterized protein (DUF305 family)